MPGKGKTMAETHRQNISRKAKRNSDIVRLAIQMVEAKTQREKSRIYSELEGVVSVWGSF